MTNCCTTSSGTHVEPRRTLISLAVRSAGCTCSSAFTLISNRSG